MKVKELLQLRLVNRKLTSTEFKTCVDVVFSFRCNTISDYPIAKWAVGTQMRKAIDSDVEKCVSSGDIIRTHILTPTRHGTLLAAAMGASKEGHC
ncbi:MAG: hypothetical protein C0490_28045 [Marivirga sp.]|nr:hypothetical protein [Marivirga sp.]